MGPDVRPTEIVQDDNIRRLDVLSAGCIGTVSRIVEQAAIHAMKENSFKIRREHLVRVVDDLPGPAERLVFPAR